MRKKIISIIIMLIAVMLLTYGLMLAQYTLINGYYVQMIGGTPATQLEDLINSLNL
jgi:ABC-type transport system involved in multi-copper enzyme maturation permease subunit